MLKYFIGGEITAAAVEPFCKFLNENEGQEVEVEICSPGGEVLAGLQMAQAMEKFTGKITCKCGLYAASMAGVLALMGDKLTCNKNSFLMLHAPMTGNDYANAKEHREHADFLDQLTATIKNYLHGKVKDAAALDTWLDSDSTWFGADAMAENFGAEVLGAGELIVFNKGDFAKMKDLPEALKTAFDKENKKNLRLEMLIAKAEELGIK